MMANYYRHTAVLCYCMFLNTGAFTQPDLSMSQVISGHTVYRDAKNTALFYYVPFDYQLAVDLKGKPDFSLVQMRYTGTRASDDPGAIKYHNLLQFRVTVDPAQNQKLDLLKNELKKTIAAAELRPLPVRKFSSILVFASTGDPVINEDSLRLVKTTFEAQDENAPTNNSFWTDRTITLRLNNEDAQLVETALRNHNSALSFSYAIYTIFTSGGAGELEVYGNKTVKKKIRDYFANEIKNQQDSALRITLVKADAINLAPDPDAWKDLIQKIDINEKMPARYPLFDVYCYDFNNELRADLFAKKIEIRASSVNGAVITTSFTFKESQPERYTKSIRFPYAVRFDKPFYYRVTEITRDGDAIASSWNEKTDWSEILDITSSPDKVVLKPTEIEQ